MSCRRSSQSASAVFMLSGFTARPSGPCDARGAHRRRQRLVTRGRDFWRRGWNHPGGGFFTLGLLSAVAGRACRPPFDQDGGGCCFRGDASARPDRGGREHRLHLSGILDAPAGPRHGSPPRFRSTPRLGWGRVGARLHGLRARVAGGRFAWLGALNVPVHALWLGWLQLAIQLWQEPKSLGWRPTTAATAFVVTLLFVVYIWCPGRHPGPGATAAAMMRPWPVRSMR